MARLGSLEEWLDATARAAESAVCFSSCFPFVEEIGFVTPPRTVWPPTSPGMMAARIRWKSARFVPLGIVSTILAGEKLDDSQWAVDGPSGCLLPSGRLGPFRMGLRGNAAVDRLSGSIEKHATACLEFRPGAGLWTVVSFADAAARERWSDPVKAAFRLLADSGFGGERSRGWGRSEAPEFVEGSLPGMMLGTGGPLSKAPKKRREKPVKAAGGQGPGAGEEPSPVAPVEPQTEEPPAPRVEEPEAEAGGQGPGAGEEPSPVEPPTEEPPAPPVEEPPVEEPPVSEPPAEEPEPREEASQREKPDVAGFSMSPDEETPESEPTPVEPEPASSDAPAEAVPEPVASEPEPEPIAAEPATELPAPGPRPLAPGSASYWLLSLYTPSADDTVDWSRGSYSLVHRAGRVDTSGDLKKNISMVTEGSVVIASQPPRGSAPDVAPDGCAHPVFRAGFAVAIPIGEAS
jgi:hypothetical protein